MTLSEWVEESRGRIREYGLREGGVEAAKAFWTGVLCHVGRYWNYGTPIFDREWDVLVVLDACRPDVLGEVASDYDYLPHDIPATYSAGSCSPEWMRKNFQPQYQDVLDRTAYVTANPFSGRYDASQFGLLDEVWRDEWSDDYKTIPPGAVTDHAIAAGRRHDNDRLIVHYMQPHEPYPELAVEHPEWFTVGDGDDAEEGDGGDADVSGERLRYCEQDWGLWDRLRHGEIARDDLWRMYRDTLRWVLDDGVTPLLRNLDAEDVVVTADHGEAFGERGIYAHPEYIPAPVVKRVPWVRTSATDTERRDPDVAVGTAGRTCGNVADRLQALGYR